MLALLFMLLLPPIVCIHTVLYLHLCLPGIWVGFFGSLERQRGGIRSNTWRWVGIRARLGAQLAP